MKNKTEIAVLGGDAFGAPKRCFNMMKGVNKVTPGYAGGTTENPTYDEVSSGKTGHAEVIEIEYDPELVSYENLLTVFFGSHDPTTLNKQGADVGTQYRSVIFYTNPEQKEKAEKFIADINASNSMGASIVTEVAPLSKFYIAENYHNDYFANNKEAAYCEIVINPKLDKVQKNFASLLKDVH